MGEECPVWNPTFISTECIRNQRVRLTVKNPEAGSNTCGQRCRIECGAAVPTLLAAYQRNRHEKLKDSASRGVLRLQCSGKNERVADYIIIT